MGLYKLKIIYNSIVPFKGFYAMTFLNFIFVRKEYKKLDGSYTYKKMVNHESIHFEQEKELGFVLFYIFYLLEWLFKLIPSIFSNSNAYKNISFEKEAYENEKNFDYLKSRKRYNWINKIFK